MITQQVQSQTRVSQFYNSAQIFNPANTGRFNKSYRISGGFRSEKNIASIYNQSFFSIETKILNSVIPENDCFAIGLVGLSERSPGEGIKNDYLSFSLAYQKGLDLEGEQQIGIGFQTTLGRKRIEPPMYIFEDQLNAWIQSGFSNIDIFQFKKVDVSYFDLNAGITFQGKLNTRNFLSASTAIHHANRPTKYIQGGELRLNHLFSGHVGWENRPSARKKIYSFLLMSMERGLLENFITGSLFQSQLNTKHYQIMIGGLFRKNSFTGKAAVAMIGLKFRDIFLTISYDIPISSTNSQKGASEITLNYSGAKSRERYIENKFIIY